MKYFNDILLEFASDFKFADKTISEVWYSLCEEYRLEFEKVKKKIPFDLYLLIKETSLHDFIMEDIHVKTYHTAKRYCQDIMLSLCHIDDHYIITHKNVAQFELQMTPNPYMLQYLYGEILREGKQISHEFNFSYEGSCKIVCETLEFKKV